jgi:hypothetical protein
MMRISIIFSLLFLGSCIQKEILYRTSVPMLNKFVLECEMSSKKYYRFEFNYKYSKELDIDYNTVKIIPIFPTGDSLYFYKFDNQGFWFFENRNLSHKSKKSKILYSRLIFTYDSLGVKRNVDVNLVLKRDVGYWYNWSIH